MSTAKLKELVLSAINSRMDKTNKATQLAMAINGTYVEDTTYDDGKLQYVWSADGKQLHVEYATITDIVSKINSNATISVDLFLTEKQANKFSIVAGYTGVSILKDDNLNSEHIEMFESIGVDVTGLAAAIEFVIGELDNNTKFTYNGVEYTLLPAEEEPVITAPIFDSIDLIGSSLTASHFLLGDNMVFNRTQETTLISPYAIFFTQEQHSKISISVELNTNEYTQEELVSEIIMSADNLGDVPFNIPENAAYILNIITLIIEMGPGSVTSFTITYDGVDYVYDNTNVLITAPEEEPEVDTLYSVDCQSTSNGTFVTSSFNLGDNLTIVNNDSDNSISPFALLLTSEQAQNFSISVTGKTGVSQELVDEVAAEFQLVAYSSSELESDATISQFATEHNITHICMIVNLADYLSLAGGYEVISSATITYNGHTYVYDNTNVLITTPSEEAPIFNSLNVTGNLNDPTYETTTFQLGDDADCYTGMIAPYALFLTAEQYSSISISAQGMSLEDQNTININEFFTSASDQVLSGVPFNIPSGTTQVLFLYELFSLVTTTHATSVTITYNGVDYVYDSTNITSVAPL